MSVETVTLGCRLNFAETETIARSAPPDEDWVIVNSCAVTNEAVRQTRQAIRHAHRRRPSARILVTGCAAELDRPSFEKMPEVDRVVGNSDKLHAFDVARHPGLEPGPAFLRTRTRVPGPARDDEMGDAKTSEIVPTGLLHRVKSFVAVQTGCDHRCTFCSIWQARGPSRSLPFEAIRDAVAREIDRGAKEIVLTGVDITDYEDGLGGLCQRLLAAEARLQRLRLSSLDSIEIDNALFELIAGEPRLMPHFHLSLQAGDDMILKRMKRRHLRADTLEFVAKVRSLRPDMVFGADIIAGFPTETEAMFARSLDLVEECGLTQLHVFPYSPRPGTPAARMPQLDRAIVKERAQRLRDKGMAALRRHLDSQIGARRRVLTERGGIGRTEQFTAVRLASTVAPGAMLDVTMAGHDGRQLLAA
jgi:threonylcarbamoyladenosine tRNA methylthiotransferase MtaB